MINGYIIIFGSPGDGFTFVGPFKTGDEATKVAESMLKDDAWWVDEVVLPDWAK